jgi:hypothetical protein
LISTEPRLSDWSAAVLSRDGGRPSRTEDPLVARREFWAAPARPAPLKGAEMSLSGLGDDRQRLVIRPPADAAGLTLDLRSNTLATAVTVNGRPAGLMAAPGVWNRIRLQAPPETLVIEFQPAGPGALEVRTLARSGSWPAQLTPLPTRGPREMAFGDSDTALVRAAATYKW